MITWEMEGEKLSVTNTESRQYLATARSDHLIHALRAQTSANSICNGLGSEDVRRPHIALLFTPLELLITATEDSRRLDLSHG